MESPLPRRGCAGVLCAAGRDGDMQLLASAAQSLGSRQAGLELGGALGGLAAAAVLLPEPALARTRSGPSYKDGPDGIKYVDLIEGDGATAVDGNICKANYVLQLESTGSRVETETNFKFALGTPPASAAPAQSSGLALTTPPPSAPKKAKEGFQLAVKGGGEMPPMQVGGTRLVLIPPELAFGKDGEKCNISAGCPGVKGEKGANLSGGYLIPPDSVVKYTIELLSVSKSR